MSDAAIFERSGDLFMPSTNATGPWGADRLHGGPVLGLFARAFEAALPDPQLVCTRMTVDLYRPVPLVPLAVRCELQRQGARLVVLSAGLFAEQTQLASASALFLRPSELAVVDHSPAPPPHASLPTESLLRGLNKSQFQVATGFHTRVETRWPARAPEQPLAIWFRLPLPLVASEATSPLQAACALTDFANAVASISARARNPRDVPYINSDATLYFSRCPEGEWFCLQDMGREAERGISTIVVSVADERGTFGRVLQARLAVTR